MKLTINITDKVKEIAIEEDTNLSSLVLFLETAFPEFWKEFKIVKQVSFYNNPYLTIPTRGSYPYTGTTTTAGISGTYTFDPTSTTSYLGLIQPHTTVEFNGEPLNLDQGLFEVKVPS